jgi:hypothetical protein
MRDILERIAHALEALAAKGATVAVPSPHTPLLPSSLKDLTSSEKKEEGMQGEEPKHIKKPALPDDEWIQSLKTHPAYQGLDVVEHAAKCRLWCEINHKLFSRRRVINWLNRQEKPLQVNIKPVTVLPPVMTKPVEPRPQGVPPPPEVQEILKKFTGRSM